MDDLARLQSVPLFAELPEDCVVRLAGLATRRSVERDAVIFYEGQEADGLYVIVSGRIKVTILGEDGREIILAHLEPGDFFGEMALLDDEPRSATAVAVRDSELLVLERGHFQEMLHDADALRAMIKVLTGRLRRNTQQITSLALLDAYGRIAGLIVTLAREEGRALPDGRVAFKATRLEIANRAGTTLETVTLMLRDLERQGLLRVENDQVVVHPDFEVEHRKIHCVSSPHISRADLAVLISAKVPALARLPVIEGRLAIDISGSWARERIQQMLDLGVMDVNPNLTFQPGAAVRRGDLALALSRVLERLGWPEPPASPVKDIGKSNFYQSAVGRAVGAGLMTLAADGSFEVWRPVPGREAVEGVEALARLVASEGQPAAAGAGRAGRET